MMFTYSFTLCVQSSSLSSLVVSSVVFIPCLILIMSCLMSSCCFCFIACWLPARRVFVSFLYSHCGAQGEERSSVVLPRTSHLGRRLWAGVSVGWGGVGTSSFVFLAQWWGSCFRPRVLIGTCGVVSCGPIPSVPLMTTPLCRCLEISQSWAFLFYIGTCGVVSCSPIPWYLLRIFPPYSFLS